MFRETLFFKTALYSAYDWLAKIRQLIFCRVPLSLIHIYIRECLVKEQDKKICAVICCEDASQETVQLGDEVAHSGLVSLRTEDLRTDLLSLLLHLSLIHIWESCRRRRLRGFVPKATLSVTASPCHLSRKGEALAEMCIRDRCRGGRGRLCDRGQRRKG